MKRVINEMKLRLPAKSENESVARSIISAFCASLDPVLEELCDLRCAVSEAVTNCIVHAYPESEGAGKHYIYITAKLYENREICVEVTDKGCGIENVALAQEKSYTTGGAERSGMGFLVMESFCDAVRVRSAVGAGTSVTLVKKLK